MKTKPIVVDVVHHNKSTCVLTGMDIPPYISVEITHILGKTVAWKYSKEDVFMFQCGLFGDSVCGYKTLDEIVSAVQNAQDKLIEEWVC